MVASTKKTIESKTSSKETLLTPRFYTTNFKELSQLDVSSNVIEITYYNDAIIMQLCYYYAK